MYVVPIAVLAHLARQAPGSGEETHEPHGGIWGEKSA